MPDHLLLAIIDEPAPRPKRARALWQAFQVVAASRARFVRRDLLQRRLKKGEEVLAVLDDRNRDLAMFKLRDAARLSDEAAEALKADVEAIQALQGRYANLGFEPDHLVIEAAQRAAQLAKALRTLKRSLNSFKGIRQIRTQREWDRFLSETASTLQDLGYTNRQVAAFLTGTPEAELTTATLERFRQRVRRARETAT